jgi:hypothetical protein
MAGVTGLEPATSGVTGRRSNRLSYTPTYATHLLATCRRRVDDLLLSYPGPLVKRLANQNDTKISPEEVRRLPAPPANVSSGYPLLG